MEAARGLMTGAAALLQERRLTPILEKLFASKELHDPLRIARANVLRERGLDPTTPFTLLEGAPADGPGFAGLQIMAVSTAEGEPDVSTVPGAGAVGGRLWRGTDMRLLHLARVRGQDRGALPRTVTEQAERMFANARAALASHGFSYGDAARTWIYFARLLDWYGEFNRVRTAHHARLAEGHGLSAHPFPASTGIEGRQTDEECFMDVLAVQPGPGAAVRVLHGSARQRQAFDYGSAFSRGVVIEAGGRRAIHVSGTASIDAGGRSVHVGDADAQVAETLLNVAALLEPEGAKLSDIASAVIYCKDREASLAVDRVQRLLQLPSFPAIKLRADVCRPELLVEVEAVALL
jgi:enamine deaminase RidA (YjgF/YER057c/UK114 family)